MQVKQHAVHIWSSTKAAIKSKFGMPLKSKLNDASLHYVERAKAHCSSNHPFKAYFFISKAIWISPVNGKNGCWPEELVTCSMNVATLLAHRQGYDLAIDLLEKVSKATSNWSKTRLNARIKEIKNSATDDYIAAAERWAKQSPKEVETITGYIDQAVKFAPERAEEINRNFVFIEAHPPVVVTRAAYELLCGQQQK